MSNYSEELENEMRAHGAWTYAQACEFAEEQGLKPRSVIAKIKSLQLPYEPKPVRVTKQGEPVVLKRQYVEAIQAALEVQIASLSKLTKDDLAQLNQAVGGVEPTPQ